MSVCGGLLLFVMICGWVLGMRILGGCIDIFGSSFGVPSYILGLYLLCRCRFRRLSIEGGRGVLRWLEVSSTSNNRSVGSMVSNSRDNNNLFCDYDFYNKYCIYLGGLSICLCRGSLLRCTFFVFHLLRWFWDGFSRD